MEEDRVIIGRVFQGNKDAYSEIIARYHGKVSSILRKMLGHTPDVQDIVQEIFIKTYYHLPEYKTNYDFSAWLYRIAANHCLDELRKRKRKLQLTTSEEIEPVDSHTPEVAFLNKEGQRLLRQRMMSVEEKYRIVLELRYFESLSCEEISHRLSIPSSTVRTRLSRGKDKLREAIGHAGQGGDFHL
ncbi:RNA polymerase [Brevibacillus brevis]|uniref:RNA polymerase sigma factor n=1 Tax=Brevibacillus brevis TaxID=1393 RepID=UPI001901A711|nr:sigma-70 family RNA polymerase sigma factor [Brevibacillus brevis]MBH0331770.1 RNA polymerase [Brevibacillus brevis]